jgi:signal peptidase I
MKSLLVSDSEHLSSSPSLGDEPLPAPTPSASARSQTTPAAVVWEMVQTLVIAGLLIAFFRAFLFQNYVVEGQSMLNTLFPGERVIVSRISYIIGRPARGDVIVLQYPLDPKRDFVKRIIGLPGETVAIVNGQVFINGRPLPPETYVVYPSHTDMAPLQLGPDEYFVMGDNRAGSSDSRVWGPLPARRIIGKAWLIYYPFDKFGLVQHRDLEPIG